MTLYGRFRRMKLDTSPVGLIQGERRSGYFCTPRGAEVIGWAGVDGIHYCFVRGFGETVFAVDPTSTPGNFVRPVAGSFEDFLRLVCAVGDAAVLQQLHAWTKDFFDDFLRKNPLTPEQLEVIGKIRKKFGISPMEDPYACVKRIQESFDPGALKFGPDYCEWVPEEPKKPEEWKVFWGKAFWEGGGRSRAGEKICVEKRFVWDGETWYIPCVYACSAGLVADMFKEVSGEAVCEFEKKRNCARSGAEPAPETEERIDAENPLREEFSVRATVNGRELSESYAFGALWIPEGLFDGRPEPEPAAVWTLEHYGLDRSKCWVMRRIGLPWAGKKPKIASAEFTLSADEISVPGPCFSLDEGESVSMINPVTGERLVLTAAELSREELPESAFPDGPEEYPRKYTAMTYTLEPEAPEREISVCDCEKGDRPRPKTQEASLFPDSVGAACIGVIGGADGPTSLVMGGAGAEGRIRFAVSSLRFARPEKTVWRVLFRKVPKEDIRVRLL